MADEIKSRIMIEEAKANKGYCLKNVQHYKEANIEGIAYILVLRK